MFRSALPVQMPLDQVQPIDMPTLCKAYEGSHDGDADSKAFMTHLLRNYHAKVPYKIYEYLWGKQKGEDELTPGAAMQQLKRMACTFEVFNAKLTNTLETAASETPLMLQKKALCEYLWGFAEWHYATIDQDLGPQEAMMVMSAYEKEMLMAHDMAAMMGALMEIEARAPVIIGGMGDRLHDGDLRAMGV